MSINIEELKEAIPYIRAYKGKTLVIKLGGEVCDKKETLENIISQVSVLFQVGIRPVLVHGGGPQATELADKLNITSSFIDGRRVTNAQMIEVAKMAFAGVVNTDLVAICQKHSIPSVGISAIDGGLIVAKKRAPTEKGDFGFVGDIVSVHPELIEKLLNAGYMPVICSLASDSSGQVLNINADTIASKLAQALSATKLCLLTNVDGVLRDVKNPSTICSVLHKSDVTMMVKDGAISAGMLPKLETCLDALSGGVPRAHIINGIKSDTLLKEIFSNEGCGTLLLP